MNLYQGLNQLICYIEEHLEEEISYTKLSSFLGCSSYTMQRIFSLITGMTVTEYIKRRKFSLASLKLLEGKKVIDVATWMGYTSPTSFSRKFYELYKIHPSELKKNKIQLSFQNILTFDEKKENGWIDYRIEETDKTLFYGLKKEVSFDVPSVAEPFWESVKKEYPFIMEDLPRIAVLEEGEKSFYWILFKDKKIGEPFQLPKTKWLIFKGKSFEGKEIKRLFHQVYDEYLHAMAYGVSGKYTLELYYKDDMEIWVMMD